MSRHSSSGSRRSATSAGFGTCRRRRGIGSFRRPAVFPSGFGTGRRRRGIDWSRNWWAGRCRTCRRCSHGRCSTFRSQTPSRPGRSSSLASGNFRRCCAAHYRRSRWSLDHNSGPATRVDNEALAVETSPHACGQASWSCRRRSRPDMTWRRSTLRSPGNSAPGRKLLAVAAAVEVAAGRRGGARRHARAGAAKRPAVGQRAITLADVA